MAFITKHGQENPTPEVEWRALGDKVSETLTIAQILRWKLWQNHVRFARPPYQDELVGEQTMFVPVPSDIGEKVLKLYKLTTAERDSDHLKIANKAGRLAVSLSSMSIFPRVAEFNIHMGDHEPIPEQVDVPCDENYTFGIIPTSRRDILFINWQSFIEDFDRQSRHDLWTIVRSVDIGMNAFRDMQVNCALPAPTVIDESTFP